MRIVFVLVLLLPQEREPVPVYALKAAFLYNFATFVEWPPEAFPDAKAPFTVGVLGRDPFGDTLEETFRGRTAGGRRIVVKRSRVVDDLRNCQLVFVPEGEATARALNALKGAHVLTVGESDGFAEGGGCVNFYIDGMRVRFEINPEAAKRANLKVSSKLLRLARLVVERN